MKPQLLIIALVLVLGGLGTTYLLANNSDDSSSEVSTSENTRESQLSTDSNTAMFREETEAPAAAQSGEGVYADYSEEAVAQNPGTKLLFFHADWCSQCRSIEKGINTEGVPTGVTILKVNYDARQDLRKKYGVTLQTTFVKIDDSGNLLEKHVAYDEPTFAAVKEAIL